MDAIRRIWKWLIEPRKTPGELWALEHEVHEAYVKGYEKGLRGGYQPGPYAPGTDEQLAFNHGADDASFDLDRQW